MKIIEEEIIRVTDTYLLRNNTFINQLSNMDNNSYKILVYALAKMQIELTKTYPKIDIETYKKLDNAMMVKMSPSELSYLGINRTSLIGKGLEKTLDKLRNTPINFISYITGEHVLGYAIAQFNVNPKTKEITALISKDVFMFLLDFKLDFRKQYDTEYLIELENDKIDIETKIVKPKPNKKNILPSTLLAGYSKVDLKIVKNFKSYYTQMMFVEFKSALEKQSINKSINKTKIKLSYTIENIKVKFNLEGKYNKYSDLRKKVIDTFVNEINKSGYMIINYDEILTTGRGGKRVSKLEFHISGTNKLLELNSKVDDEIAITSNSEQSIEQQIINQIIQHTGKRLSVKTINDLINSYSLKNVLTCVEKMCDSTKKITAPKAYLTKMLINYHNENSSYKQCKFFNFESHDYDYDDLEKQLLGWDD